MDAYWHENALTGEHTPGEREVNAHTCAALAPWAVSRNTPTVVPRGHLGLVRQGWASDRGDALRPDDVAAMTARDSITIAPIRFAELPEGERTPVDRRSRAPRARRARAPRRRGHHDRDRAPRPAGRVGGLGDVEGRGDAADRAGVTIAARAGSFAPLAHTLGRTLPPPRLVPPSSVRPSGPGVDFGKRLRLGSNEFKDPVVAARRASPRRWSRRGARPCS